MPVKLAVELKRQKMTSGWGNPALVAQASRLCEILDRRDACPTSNKPTTLFHEGTKTLICARLERRVLAQPPQKPTPRPRKAGNFLWHFLRLNFLGCPVLRGFLMMMPSLLGPFTASPRAGGNRTALISHYMDPSYLLCCDTADLTVSRTILELCR